MGRADNLLGYKGLGGASARGTSVFCPVLCELMLRWFCPAGGSVLDPFAGGSVLMWHHSSIHWGSACSAYAPEPRKSIALSFRLNEARKPMSDKDWELYGRVPFTLEEVQRGVGVPERVRLCTRAMMMYSVWHPEFGGFDKEHYGVTVGDGEATRDPEPLLGP